MIYYISQLYELISVSFPLFQPQICIKNWFIENIETLYRYTKSDNLNIILHTEEKKKRSKHKNKLSFLISKKFVL